jgi:CheY-like chemotaxis protein
VNTDPLSGHILVVDDDDMNLDILSRRLQREGHTVTTASMIHALDTMRTQPFDMLLDIMMPR